MFKKSEESTDVRKSEFALRTPVMAKAFMAITGATIIMAAVFNFTMAGHRSTLIAEKAIKKAEQEDRRTRLEEAAAARKKLAEARAQPFPQTSSVQWKQVYPPGTGITLLTITDATGDGRNKIIKIVDQGSGVEVANLYVQANTKAYVSLPTTLYDLSVIEGDEWLGAEINFGPKGKETPIGEVNLLRQYDLVLRFTQNSSATR